MYLSCIYSKLTHGLRKRFPYKKLTQPYARAGFAYAQLRYDNTLIWFGHVRTSSEYHRLPWSRIAQELPECGTVALGHFWQMRLGTLEQAKLAFTSKQSHHIHIIRIKRPPGLTTGSKKLRRSKNSKKLLGAAEHENWKELRARTSRKGFLQQLGPEALTPLPGPTLSKARLCLIATEFTLRSFWQSTWNLAEKILPHTRKDAMKMTKTFVYVMYQDGKRCQRRTHD